MPTLQEHFLDAQDAAALPIWRPEIFFKYPEGPDLSAEEIEGLLELFRSCLLGKRAVKGLALRTADNIHETQIDSYQLGILTLNLGHVNRVPYIGGSSKFPSWVRRDNQYRCLPYLVFRHSAHITCLCKASDEHGGIALHQQVARDHGMIGMVVHLCIQRSIPSRLLFLSEEVIQLELLLNCLAITNVKLRIRKRQTNSGYFMEQFFASAMAGTHPENSLIRIAESEWPCLM